MSGHGAKIRLMAVVWASAMAWAAMAGPFRLVSNRSFAARCNGPMGAIIIRDQPGWWADAKSQAAQVKAQHSDAFLRRAIRPLQRLAARGVIRGPVRLRFPRVAVHLTSDGKIVLPDLVKAQKAGKALGHPTNEIRFHFQGFDQAAEESLRAYLDAAYPVARSVYGPPAFDIDVTIIQDPNLSDIQGGYYDVSRNEIHIAPLTGNFPEDTAVLIKLVLHAFHDDAIFFFDAWEEGFAGAAAYVVQTTPGVSPGYLPYDPGPFYCSSVYEAENQPPLGNPTFYPESGYAGMLVWRLAMARAAWLKCWVEDRQFFAKFNTEYYRRYTPSLAGDTAGLRDIAAAVLPEVEGLPFWEWYEQQYVLDTSARVGPKLYTWNIPLPESVALIVNHYATDANGNEFPRGGRAFTIYWNYDFSVSLYAEEGNVIDIPDSGDDAGVGFLIPTFFNIGGPQRITVQIDVNGLRAYYPYPYGLRGFDPGENNIYGAIIGGMEGTVDISGPESASGVQVSRGVWGTEIAGGHLYPMQLEITYTDPGGHVYRRKVNVAWDSYVVFIRGGGQTQVSHTFRAGLHMMSLPIYPLTPSVAEVLGLPETSFLMARWDPRLGAGRYRIWPDMEPFTPGRAFWLRVYSDFTLNCTGILPDPELDFPVTIYLGWNMIGSPRLASVPVENLRIQEGTEPSMPFSEAVTNHLVQSTIYTYDASVGYVLADAIEPFAGYWIRSLKAGELRVIFPPAGAAASSAAAGMDGKAASAQGKSALDSADWAVRICARAGSGAANVVVGRASKPVACAAPPPGPGGVRLFSQAGGQQCGVDLRPAQCRWRLELAGPAGGEARVWAEPLRGRAPHLLVREPASGRSFVLSSAHRTLRLGPSGKAVLEVAATSATGPVTCLLKSAAAQQAGRAVQVTFTLAAPAAVSGRVLNIAGRTVRVLASDKPLEAGTQQLLWPLNGPTGAPVPPGLYLIELQARADSGESQRIILPTRVRR